MSVQNEDTTSNGYGLCTLCGVALAREEIRACQLYKLLGVYCDQCMFDVLSQCMQSGEDERYE